MAVQRMENSLQDDFLQFIHRRTDKINLSEVARYNSAYESVKDAYGTITSSLPPAEVEKGWLRLEETISDVECQIETEFYQKGFKDGINFLMSMLKK